MGLKQWDQFGPTGHSQWSGSAENSYVASKADVIPLRTLIHILQQSRKSTRSKTDTMLIENCRFSLKRRVIRVSFRLQNVRVFAHVLSISDILTNLQIQVRSWVFHARKTRLFLMASVRKLSLPWRHVSTQHEMSLHATFRSRRWNFGGDYVDLKGGIQ